MSRKTHSNSVKVRLARPPLQIDPKYIIPKNETPPLLLIPFLSWWNKEIRDLEEKFTALAEAEVDFLLKKNRTFIKESKLFEDGGEYSKDEVAWYETMITEIDG